MKNNSELKNILQKLQGDTKADATLVVTTDGNFVESCGMTDTFDLHNFSALIASIFIASKEVTLNLEEKNTINVSYLESLYQNIYVSLIDQNYLLVVIFKDKSNKGIVWYYSQQAIKEMKNMLGKTTHQTPVNNSLSNLFSGPMEKDIHESLDELWGEKKQISSTAKVPPFLHTEEDNSLQEPILSYDEAVRKGIIENKDQ